jgi:hypothetical protein
MNDLVPHEKKQDAFTRILQFYQEDIPLGADEEVILNRWHYCDKLMKSRKLKYDDIIDKMREQFKFQSSLHKMISQMLSVYSG